MKSPLFIFSNVRSGSTMLQRVLMSHSKIASLEEPWLLLPYCSPTETSINFQIDFDLIFAKVGITNFIDNLPNKELDYYKELYNFLLRLYKKQCKNQEHYFLDKTPRYYSIIPEIFKIFPNAKYIFLFRNPLDTLISMSQTMASSQLSFLDTHYDTRILNGKTSFDFLAEGYETFKSKSYLVHYESFVNNPSKELDKIFKYLNLPFEKNILTNFSNQLKNNILGDRISHKSYHTISNKSINTCHSFVNTLEKKQILIKYIQSLNTRSLSILGYPKEELLDTLNSVSIPDVSNIQKKNILKISFKAFIKNAILYPLKFIVKVSAYLIRKLSSL